MFKGDHPPARSPLRGHALPSKVSTGLGSSMVGTKIGLGPASTITEGLLDLPYMNTLVLVQVCGPMSMLMN